MLADIPEIRSSLEELVLVASSDEKLANDAVLVAPKTRRQFPGGKVDQVPTLLTLQQRHAATISTRRLVQTLADALAKAGHSHCQKASPVRLDIASRLLALALLTRPSRDRMLEEVNSLFTAIAPVNLCMWSVLIAPATNRELDHFGDFCYGVINIDDLQRLCDYVGSDYADLYAANLRGRRSVLRSGISVNMVNLGGIARDHEYPREVTAHHYRLTDEYHSVVAEQERLRFLADLDRQQAPDGTAGLGTMSSDALLRMEAATQWIAVFYRDTPVSGWVVPHQTFYHITTTEPRAYEAGRLSIRTNLGLEDWGKRPLDETVQRFCEYFTGAQALAASGRLEEALLHFVFGLDLLLGGEAKEALTELLSERTALLTHRCLGQSMSDLQGFVKDCYDMRSGYAHRGKRGTLDTGQGGITLEGRVDLLEFIGRVVFGASCVARRESWAQTKDARAVWMKRIYLLRAKLAASMALDAADYASLGLDRVQIIPDRVPTLTLAPAANKMTASP
jgi:hypothetical protein